MSLALILLEWDADAARLGPTDEDDPRPDDLEPAGSPESYRQRQEDRLQEQADRGEDPRGDHDRVPRDYDDIDDLDADTYGEDWPF